MKKYSLGKTGIKVTEMCFGALPIGPLQANISVEEGAKLLRLNPAPKHIKKWNKALKMRLNPWDGLI